MKASIKLAVIGAIALMGGVAQAAPIINLANAPGGSDLVLFLKDSTTGTFFVQDLGVQTSALRSNAQLAADGVGAYTLDNATPVTGPLSVPALLNGYTSPNLTSYLTGHGSDAIQWSILGANANTGVNTPGAQSVVLTSTIDQLNAYWDTTMVGASRGSINNFFGGDINTGTFVNGVSSTNGWGDSSIPGSGAPITFQGSTWANGAALGSAQTLYLMSTGGAGNGANTYASLAGLTLSTAGVFSYSGADLAGGTAPVPVPAAIWLLGSGLMGLVGIGRRRNAANVAA